MVSAEAADLRPKPPTGKCDEALGQALLELGIQHTPRHTTVHGYALDFALPEQRLGLGLGLGFTGKGSGEPLLDAA